MSGPDKYYVVLFPSVNHVMKAERVLRKCEISFKLIPVPKYLSSDCGVCIRFTEDKMEKIEACLENTVEYAGITSLISD